MNKNKIKKEFKLQIQKAKNIEEEMYIWNMIFDDLVKGKHISEKKQELAHASSLYKRCMFKEPYDGVVPFKNISKDEFVNIDNKDEEEQYSIIRRCPNAIKNINNPSKRIQVESCRYDGSLLKYIDKQYDEACIEASKTVYNMGFIKNPSMEMYKNSFMKMWEFTRMEDGSKPDYGRFNYFRDLKLIPRQLYRENSWGKTFQKELEKLAEKTVVPLANKHIKNLEKACESESESRIIIAELSAIHAAYKFTKQLMTLPFRIAFFAPNMIAKTISCMFHYQYLSIIYGIETEHLEKFQRYSNNKTEYGIYILDMKKDLLR